LAIGRAIDTFVLIVLIYYRLSDIASRHVIPFTVTILNLITIFARLALYSLKILVNALAATNLA